MLLVRKPGIQILQLLATTTAFLKRPSISLLLVAAKCGSLQVENQNFTGRPTHVGC